MRDEWTREDWERTMPLLRGGSLRPGRVRGADWSKLNLMGADLSDCVLSAVDLTGANLTRVNLVGSKLTDGCVLAGADLTEARLEEADLRGCNLTGAQLDRATYNEGTRWPEEFSLKGKGLTSLGERGHVSHSYVELWTERGKCYTALVEHEYVPYLRRVWRQAIHSIAPAQTQVTTQVEHGWYTGLSRYCLEKLEYAGAGDGYPAFTEALEIKNPPKGRGRGVLYNYDGLASSWFAEFDTPEQARQAYKQWWSHWSALPSTQEEKLRGRPGFRRFVNLGVLTPWFYALGNEQLYVGDIYDGDFVLPDWLVDHPTYRLGSWWLVTGRDKEARPVQCLGASRFIQHRQVDSWREVKAEVVRVFWSDGTTTESGDEYVTTQQMRPDQSVYMAEAHRWLDEVLSGRRDHVVLDTIGGHRLTMRVGALGKTARRAGMYEYDVTFDRDIEVQVAKRDEWGQQTDETEPKYLRQFTGSLNFQPTPECKTPEAKFRAMLAKNHPGVEIVKLRLKLMAAEGGGQRWSGVYWGDTPLAPPVPLD